MDTDPTNQASSPSLQLFADKLLAEKGLTDLEPSVLDELKKDLINEAEDRIKAGLIELLPPAKLADFQALLDDNAPEQEIQDFLKNNITDLEQHIAAILMNFRSIFLGE